MQKKRKEEKERKDTNKNSRLLRINAHMNENEEYFPLEQTIPFIERVQCSHWEDQGIIVVFSMDKVAKLTSAQDDRLLWERQFTKRVLNYLLDGKITPCLTRFIEIVQCPQNSPSGRMLWRQIHKSEQGNAAKKHQSPLFYGSPSPYSSKRGSEEQLVGFVLERAPGIPMHQWAAQRHSMQQWRYVLFQLFYTLATFNDIGLHHNDVHLENVFIDDAGWPEPIVFFPSSSSSSSSSPSPASVTIPAGREAPAVRFIDFDKASLSKNKFLPKEWQNLLDTNPTLETNLCSSFGLCNHHGKNNAKFDPFTLLCTLLYGIVHYKYQIPDELQRWIKEEAMPRGKRLYEADFEGKGGFLCRLSHHFGTNNYTAGNANSYIPTDDEQRSTDFLLLQSSLFQQLFQQKSKSEGRNVFRRPF